jgi:hypothetical protein
MAGLTPCNGTEIVFETDVNVFGWERWGHLLSRRRQKRSSEFGDKVKDAIEEIVRNVETSMDEIIRPETIKRL